MGGQGFISTIAEITFYGRDQNGNEVSVTGRIDVQFGDFGDIVAFRTDSSCEPPPTSHCSAPRHLPAVAGCTVKDVDQPALAGPSTFANSITMVADRDTLTQNGVDFTDIRITALGPDGQSENIPLRAQIYVDGVPKDFGTLSTKTPITPTTIRYTAPPASTLAAASGARRPSRWS